MTDSLTNQLDSCTIHVLNSNNSSSNGPSLFDMPISITGEIVDKMDFNNRLVVRNVCRKLRNFIDNTNPGYKDIRIDVRYDRSLLVLDGNYTYTYLNKSPRGIVGQAENLQKSEENTHLNLILRDLVVLMRNPELRLNSLNFIVSWNYETIVKWFEELAESKNQIHCKLFNLDAPGVHRMIPFLSHFKPGVLERIGISDKPMPHSEISSVRNICEFFDIVESEQWKQAKHANIPSVISPNFSIEHVFHLSSFAVMLEEFIVSDAIKIRDILMKSALFECGIISAEEDIQKEVVKVFVPEFNKGILRDPYRLLEFEVDKFQIRFAMNSLLIMDELKESSLHSL